MTIEEIEALMKKLKGTAFATYYIYAGFGPHNPAYVTENSPFVIEYERKEKELLEAIKQYAIDEYSLGYTHRDRNQPVAYDTDTKKYLKTIIKEQK